MITYDMTMSDLMMKIGSQLWLVIMLILVLWSEEKGTFPANNIRSFLEGKNTRVSTSIPPRSTPAINP